VDREIDYIKRAKKDVSAFDYLYQKYFPKINNFVYHRVFDDGIRHEIVSNVFYKAMLKIKQFSIFDSKQSNFSAWLYRIAINEINQYYRNCKREGKISAAVKWNFQDFQEDNETEVSYEKLYEKMKLLNQEEQTLLTLRFFEKMRYKEIADIMKKKENAIKVRVHRILTKLRESLEGEIYEAI
jgi:RNA polymerase sigma-70 factor (ECF subfamily)